MAQAVAARTYVLYVKNKNSDKPYDVEATTASQVYGGYEAETYASNSAVDGTQGQVMTYNDPDWSVFWCRGSGMTSPPSSTTLYIGKHVGEDPDTTRLDETLGYIVIESGNGTVDGLVYWAGLGPDIVQGMDNGPPFSYSLDSS